MASKRSKREENKLEAEILRLELTLKAHKMACQMGVPGACEAADAVREDIEARRRELERIRARMAGGDARLRWTAVMLGVVGVGVAVTGLRRWVE